MRTVARRAASGVDGIVVAVGYRGDDVAAHCGEDVRGVPLTDAWLEERLGLGHAVPAAEV